MTNKHNRGKQLDKKKPRGKKKRRDTRFFILGVVFVFALTIVGIGLLSTTQATLKDSDNKTNNFSYGDLKAELIEEFEPNKNIQVNGPAYVKKVSVKNAGEVDSFIRVLVLPEILSKIEKDTPPVLLPSVIGQELELLDGLGVPIVNTNDWQNGKDGYFYYLKKLKPGQTTVALFDSVKVSSNLITKDSLYENATLDIQVKVEGIHTTEFAYRDGWWQGKLPVEPNLIVVDDALKVIAH